MADHDMVGRWMSHHLAELVSAAEDDATTVEQRLEIVDTILRIWAHRGSLPRPAPLEDFSRVFVALDRLGDERPWRFLRLFEVDAEPPSPTSSGPPLGEIAVELERLTRETVLHLLWRAAQDAAEHHQGWLDVANRIQSTVETDVANTLHRYRRSAAIRRAMSANGAGAEAAEEHADESPFSDASQALLLRDMARLLDSTADKFTASGRECEDPPLP